jgi:DNA/RNA endonuclease G (NUC1)
MRRATMPFALLVFIALASAAAAQPDPTNANTCKQQIWGDIGLPTSATANDEDHTRVCHMGYITGHNSVRKTPDWVVERLSPDLTKCGADRPGIKFKPDPALGDRPKAVPDDYAGGTYVIGHQAPSADFTCAELMMRDTFFLSNAVPQIGNGFNTGVWSTLERLVKTLAKQRDPLFVITGPVYQQRSTVTIKKTADACKNEIVLKVLDDQTICPERNANPSAVCNKGVAVPAALYKIIYDPGNGGRVSAYLLPNVDHMPIKQNVSTQEYLKRYLISVRTIEELTGYQFLTELSARKQTQLKESCGMMFR